jgi:hypothetical protein
MGDCRERQLAEVQAVDAIYKEDGECTAGGVTTSDAALRLLLDDGDPGGLTDDAVLQFGVGTKELVECGAALEFELPLQYPKDAAQCTFSTRDPRFRRQDILQLNSGLAVAAAEHAVQEEECVFAAVQLVTDALAGIFTQRADEQSAADLLAEAAAAERSRFDAPRDVLRVFFWAHHIRAKHVDAIEHAKALGITGVIKWGWPGYVYAEGAEDSVQSYIKTVKAWHWKECKLAWQESAGPDAPLLAGGCPMRVVEEEDFFALFRSAGRLDILEAGTGHPFS